MLIKHNVNEQISLINQINKQINKACWKRLFSACSYSTSNNKKHCQIERIHCHLSTNKADQTKNKTPL